MATEVIKKYTQILSTLPDYVMDFFLDENTRYQPKTKLAYAVDLRVFFWWIIDTAPQDINRAKLSEVTKQDLDKLRARDINLYMMWLEQYEMPDFVTGKKEVYENSPSGQKRKLAVLKSFFKFLYREEYILQDPTALVKTPKIKEKEIFILSEGEKDRILNEADTGRSKADHAKSFHSHSKYRDMAILSTFLGTGIRVSELVNINLYDLDFTEQRILVTRKGGNREYVYFNSTVLDALTDYLDIERASLAKIDPEKDEDGPLFVSNRGTRITVGRVEQIVKEYAHYILPASSKSTPHTLRKTYGTELYQKYFE